ncbi:oligopeptide/dipeptide ABC transporter ATP-binding protein [uncultured Sphaerochaeta sp.]|uniref:ABC transporter ATP-binding protein n=1 Tax=uncultured Sphaerochaeta sp. TaxID=886478 RepID=UPI002A0A7842|nr:oligopeptide/dipeptide ABC transporter ATP-binding protein [uncultured Sphaerochaeta sp.]
MENSRQPIIQIKGVSRYFPVKNSSMFSRKKDFLKAVNDVSLNIYPGDTIGIVGESGCGKTTLAKMILHLQKPTKGQILYNGVDIYSLGKKETKKLRTEIQIVFQDPFSSLNPRMRVGDIIGEPLKIHYKLSKDEYVRKVQDIMARVGINPKHINRYPHEFSGGQRQRIMIAKALILRPKVLVCDEPVSALDVSIRSEILNLLSDLKKEMEFTILFISHDLTVIEYICSRIAVMYLGKVVESAGESQLYKDPIHPYTKALLSAIPIPNPHHKSTRIILEGDVPSPINPPIGCFFKNRCIYKSEKCNEPPKLVERSENHFVACHNC